MLILKANINDKTYYFALLNEEKRYILGSDVNCDFTLPFKGVSRKHCQFFYKKENWWVKDLNSTNGTYLNGNKVLEDIIKENDLLSCGVVNIKILKEPTADWTSTDGKGANYINSKNNIQKRKITEHILINEKENFLIDECAKILYLEDDLNKKYEDLMNLLGIKNIKIVNKTKDDEILVFSKITEENKEFFKIPNIIKDLEIKIYPEINEEKQKIAFAFFNMLSLPKIATGFIPHKIEENKEEISSPLGVSPIVKKIWVRALVYKDSKIPILITGETGVGKEYFARQLHNASIRAKKPFIPINFSEYPESLIQSEIFGIEEKIATGVKKNIGKLEQGSGGTILLDEIGDVPKEWQLMLLRVLENNYFYRVGGIEPVDLNVRFIFATNKNVDEEVEKGRIRIDFYYRIKGIHFHIPPLRERKEDVEYFLKKILDDLNIANNSSISYSVAAWDTLVNYNWPGNLRELKFEIEKIYPLALQKGIIQKEFLTIDKKQEDVQYLSLKEEVEKLERALILRAINTSKSISKAIKSLKIPRTTFYQKIKKYKIKI